MSGEITVTYAADGSLRARTRGHEIRMDQPFADGGHDSAPTPTELFVAGLVGCVAHYARRYLERHNVAPTELRVSAEWAFASDRPARVGSVVIVIHPPAGLAQDRVPALLAVASHCTVHNSLMRPPDVRVCTAGTPLGTTA